MNEDVSVLKGNPVKSRMPTLWDKVCSSVVKAAVGCAVCGVLVGVGAGLCNESNSLSDLSLLLVIIPGHYVAFAHGDVFDKTKNLWENFKKSLCVGHTATLSSFFCFAWSQVPLKEAKQILVAGVTK